MRRRREAPLKNPTAGSGKKNKNMHILCLKSSENSDKMIY